MDPSKVRKNEQIPYDSDDSSSDDASLDQEFDSEDMVLGEPNNFTNSEFAGDIYSAHQAHLDAFPLSDFAMLLDGLRKPMRCLRVI